MINGEKPSILIATNNVGKLAEFERLLSDDYQIDGLAGLNLELPAEGTTSYKENAEAKAVFVAAASGRLTLGDDSGIEARVLGGAPGIVSARYAGEPVSDSRNIEKLLTEIDAQDYSDRAARFVCWLALADAKGLIASVVGTCEGQIGFEPVGTNGFGYDPVFLFPSGLTMAELSETQKDEISHRGNAVRAMMPVLARAVSQAAGNA